MANKEFQVRHGLVVNNNVLVANTVTGNVGIGTSNPAYTLDVFGTINAANVLMNGGAIAANLAPVFAVANAAFDAANNVGPQIAPAYNTANAAYGVANASFGHSNTTYGAVNSAFGVINSAYNLANTKYSSSGGTISGNVNISGDLNVHGNTYFTDQQTLIVSDPLIYLAGNNYTSDVVDIGFVANYVNTGGANVHTGLYRTASTKEYYLFQGYDKEPYNNYIDPAGNNFTKAVLNADIRTSNLNLGGANAITWIKSSYDNSNGAFGIANGNSTNAAAAFGLVNTTYAAVNSAFAVINAAYTSSNADYVVSNAAFTVANAAFGTANVARVNVGPTSPTSPANGQLWWSTTSARMYIYYADANSSQWVEASPSSATIDGTIITGYINPVYDIANAAFTVANSAFAYQNSDYTMSNAAYTVANAAFGKANAALANTSGVYFNGNLYFPSGNVGIGTTSSLAKLDVVTNLSNYTSTLGSIDSATVRILNNSVAGLGISSKLNFNIANIGSTVLSGYYATFNGSNDIGTGLIIGTQTNAAGGTVERMRIDQVGNVGIGNTAPKLKLEVAGNMSVDAFVENSANITTSYTITAGRNAMTAGPITVNSGVTVEVPAGSTWTVV